MPSWFKKVFSSGAADPKAAPAVAVESSAQPVSTPPSVDNPALGKPDTSAYEEEPPKKRTIVQAPILVSEEDQSSYSDEISIKAQVDKEDQTCKLMVDRPVLDGLSAWFPGATWTVDTSPLAAKLFEISGVESVLLYNTTITLSQPDMDKRPWEDVAKEAGAVVRDFLKSGDDAVTPAFHESIPPMEEIRMKIQACIDLEINPGISGHGGVVTLERVEGNAVFLTMGGGCQGCAASAITLRQGIHTTFRNAVPQIGGIFDETDHTAGSNPFFKELPAEMA